MSLCAEPHPANLSKGVALTISGKLGDNAKHYQEKELVKKIKEFQK